MATKKKPVGAPPAAVVSESRSPEQIAVELVWCTGEDSPNGRRVLDVRPGSRSLLSASADEAAALNVMAPGVPEGALRGAPLPDDPVLLAVAWPFSVDELSRVARGFRPETMEDKWRIVTRKSAKGRRVYFFRSWTNTLVAVLEIEDSRGTSLAVTKGLFQPEASIRSILDGYLFDCTCIVPAPSELGTDRQSLMTWGISGAGRRCDYVEPATSRVYFPSSSELGLEPGHKDPSAIERQLPRELQDEAMGQRGFGLTNVFREVLAMLRPSRENAVRNGFLPTADTDFDHDRLAVLRRFLDAVAGMDERQLRSVAEWALPPPTASGTDEHERGSISAFRDTPRSRWVVWGRGEPSHAWLRARPSPDAASALLAETRRDDPAFALGHAAWIVEIVATGEQLLDAMRGEGTVRGWLHGGPPPLTASSVTPPAT